MTARAVLFDIDGTLISTGGAGAVAWRRAFEDLYGVPADIGAFSDAGMTDPEVGRRTFAAVLGHEPSAEELSRVMARRLVRLPWAVAESSGYAVLDGVLDTLEDLSGRGLLLGLTTGGMEAAARIKLERADLNRFFEFGGYGSDSPDRTRLTRRAVERAGAIVGGPLEPAEVMVVGDTPLDVAAARGAGATAVAVASGHFSADVLRESGADVVLDSLTQGLPV